MKISEFKKMVNRCDDADEVCIAESKGSIGPSATIGVKSSGTGIDWDSGKFIIYPNKKIIEKEYNRELFEDLKSICSDYLWMKKDLKRPDYHAKKIYEALNKPDWASEYFDKPKA